MKRKLLLFIATLFLGGVMYAQDFHFGPDFDYHDYQRPMIIIGQVYFNGAVQNSADIEIASFVGDEVRGRVMLMEPFPDEPDLGYFAYLPCYYNSTGETFTFKAYDHATGKEYDACSTTAVGQDDGYGDVDNPYDFYFTFEEEVPFGPLYPWTPNTNFPGEGMLVVAQIQVNGAVVDNGNWVVGAFLHDECRATSGTELDDWTDVNLGYFAFMNIMGEDGDEIEFYLFDKTSDKVIDAQCSTTVELVNGAELGIDILGGDIFILNFMTKSTLTKEIIGYTTGQRDYYLIASPFGDVNPTEVTNMLENSYDLFAFDEEKVGEEWRNYKLQNFDLEPGKGYLYANSLTTTLTFTGYPYDGDGKVTLAKTDDTPWAGWNLVGNPFAETAYINKAFYVMKDNGLDFKAMSAGDPILAMEGLFVIAGNDGEELVFTKEPISKCANLLINVSNGNRSSEIDRAIVNFGEGSTLPKFMLNGNNTKLYIREDGEDYAIVNAEDHGEITLNFKARTNGNYSLNFKPEDIEFSYLHLTDLLTGNEVDLLESPSYSFESLSTDNASRFKLVFEKGYAGVSEEFAFISNGNIIFNGQGTIQVVDALGRILVSCENGTRTVSTDGMTPGVYVLRLINGKETKTQKIVVR